ncbi:MAG: hypothetical protein WC254_03060 [Candidatus Woesearchaeota archaeon]|jgi:hypothetical protein
MSKKNITLILVIVLLFVVSCEQNNTGVQEEQKTETSQTGDLFDEVLAGQTITDTTEPQEEIQENTEENVETEPIISEDQEEQEPAYDDPSCGDDICTYYETYSSCPEDCNKLEEITLNDYPEFLDDPILVVGDEASTTDVITATVISTYLVANGITPITKLASEITSFTTDDLILIGSPCENEAIATLLHYTSETCSDIINGQNNAVIKLLVNPTNEIIILTGYDIGDTKDASAMLTDMNNAYNLNGAEEWINLNSDGINMYFSKN